MAAGDVALNIIVSASTGAAMSALQGLGKGISDMAGGGIMGKLAEGAIAAGVGIVGIGVAAVKSAGDFQQSMTLLVTSAGESKSAIAAVSAGILKMSIDTGTSTQQLGAGMYYIESAGYHGAAGLNVLKTAAMGAKTENADLDTVAKALTTVMTDYGMKASDSAKAMNGLIATVQNGKTNLQQLSASMGAVLPIASAMKISFPQVAGAMATMTNSGMSAQQASQNLAHVLIALQSPSGVAVKSMFAVGLSAQQVKDTLVNQGLPQALQLIEDHVGKKFPAGSVMGETALKNIMGGIVGLKLAAMLTGPSLVAYEENIKKIAAAMKDGSGAVMGWDDIQGNFNFKIGQAKQALNVLMITLGTALLPVVGQAISAIVGIITSFTTWATKTHMIEAALASVASVVKNVSTIIGVMSTAISGVVTRMGAVVTQATATMAVQSTAQTLSMKLQSITHTQSMAQTNIATLEGQRAAYERISVNSRNSVVLHANEMKIQSIDAAIKMNQGVVENAQKMSLGVTNQMNAMVPSAHLQMLRLQLDTINSTLATKTSVIAHLQSLRDGLDKEMARASTVGTQHMIQLKINSVDAALKMNQGVVAQTSLLRTKVVDDFTKTQGAVNSINANPITRLSNALATVITFFTKTELGADTLKGVIAGASVALLYMAATAIPGIVAGFVAWAIAMAPVAAESLAVYGPILAIGVAVAAVVAAFLYFYKTSAPFKTFIDGLVQDAKNLWAGLVQLGQYISGALAPVFKIIGNVMKSEMIPALQEAWKAIQQSLVPAWQSLQAAGAAMLPALKSLWTAMQPLGPVLKSIGVIIVGVLLVALVSLSGLIVAIVKGAAGLAIGLATAFKGVAQVVQGLAETLSGVVQFIIDLFTGKFGKLQGDLALIWKGIVDQLGGAWNIAFGLVQGVLLAIAGLFTGFYSTVINIFTNLYNDLIGHSIIPNIVQGIFDWFKKIPVFIVDLVKEIATAFVNGWDTVLKDVFAFWDLVKTIFASAWTKYINPPLTALTTFISGWFSTLATNFGTWATKAMTMFTSAISGGVSNVTNAVTGIGTAIGKILGFHSPPTTGPLSTSDKWMPAMVTMMATGIAANSPKVTTSVNTMATGINSQFTAMNGQVGNSINNLNNTVTTGFQTMSSNVQSNTSSINSSMNGLQSNVDSKSSAINSAIAGMSAGAISNLNNLNGQVQTVSTAIPKAMTTVGSSVSQVTPVITGATVQWTQNMVDAGQIVDSNSKKAITSVSTAATAIPKYAEAFQKGTQEMSANAAEGMSKVNQTVVSGAKETSGTLDKMGSGMKQTFNDIGKAGSDFEQVNQTLMKGIVDSAKSAGSNLMGNIKDMIKMAQEGAAQVASAWAAMTGHSVPKIGPMKDDDKWGDHFMQNIVGGMKRGIPSLTATTSTIAGVMAGVVPSVASSITGSISVPQGASSTALTGGTTRLIVNLDSKVLADATLPRIAKEIRVQGGARKL